MRDEQEKGFVREMAFLRQLRHCMRIGKRVSRVDLYQHLNNIYKNDPARNLYMGEWTTGPARGVLGRAWQGIATHCGRRVVHRCARVVPDHQKAAVQAQRARGV